MVDSTLILNLNLNRRGSDAPTNTGVFSDE